MGIANKWLNSEIRPPSGQVVSLASLVEKRAKAQEERDFQTAWAQEALKEMKRVKAIKIRLLYELKTAKASKISKIKSQKNITPQNPGGSPDHDEV